MLLTESQFVCIAPDDLFTKAKGSGFIKLTHPKSKENVLFYWDKEEQNIYEIQQHFEPHRSWLLGNTIKKDGRLYIFTKIDPLFLLLSTLQKESEKFTPIDHLLTNELAFLSESSKIQTRLSNIADVKDTVGLHVCRYNETKTLVWLQGKLDRVKNALDNRPEFYQENDAGVQDNLEIAWALVTEYVATETGTKLADKVGLDLEVAPVMPSLPTVSSATDNPAKKGKLDQPNEDYSKFFNKENLSQKLDGKLKKPPPPGSQSITSFFAKKKT